MEGRLPNGLSESLDQMRIKRAGSSLSYEGTEVSRSLGGSFRSRACVLSHPGSHAPELTGLLSPQDSFPGTMKN